MAAGDEILNWIKDIKEQDVEELYECPHCGWDLEKHPDTGQLHCKFCGWPWKK
jgi:ribosomal protein L37AE/L43A